MRNIVIEKDDIFISMRFVNLSKSFVENLSCLNSWTTCKACKQLDFNNVVPERPNRSSKLKEKHSHKLDRISARNTRPSLNRETCSFLAVKLRRLQRKSYENKYDIRNNIRNCLLYLQTVLITAGPGAQCRMQVSNMFTFNFIFCPWKLANSWRFKNKSCNRNDPEQCI